jgi:hypothetical protein
MRRRPKPADSLLTDRRRNLARRFAYRFEAALERQAPQAVGGHLLQCHTVDAGQRVAGMREHVGQDVPKGPARTGRRIELVDRAGLKLAIGRNVLRELHRWRP